MNISNGKNLIIRVTGNKLVIPALKVHKVFRAAWQLWSNVAPLKFRKRARGEADIVISFYSGGESLLSKRHHEAE